MQGGQVLLRSTVAVADLETSVEVVAVVEAHAGEVVEEVAAGAGSDHGWTHTPN